MPILSVFYGIIVRMLFRDTGQHDAPHIHVDYGEHRASIGIPEGDVLAGSLPRKQLRLVQAWIELHTDELMAAWTLASAGEPVERIPPLQ